MNFYRSKIILALSAALLLGGCTFSTHIDKNRYWQMQDNIATLPTVSIEGGDGYVRYPEIFRQKQLFQDVVAKEEATIGVDVRTYSSGAPDLVTAFSWLIVSGCSAYLIPYRGDNVRHAEFNLYVDGQLSKTYKYDDIKSTWIWFFAFPLMKPENDEYFVEELIADQFVNSFIIDLLKDREMLEKIQLSQSHGQAAVRAPEALQEKLQR